MSRIVAVTGGAGQLGREFGRLLAQYGVEHHLLDLPDFDLTRHAEMAREIARRGPDLVIHAAAFTKVDACETEKKTAFAVNGEATAALAGFCRRAGIPIVYISTDFVFDGAKREPYRTDDEPNPLSVYGLSKLAGERGVLDSGAEAWIVRTAWLYGVHGWNFPRAILRQAAQGTVPRVVTDQVGAPTHAGDLAAAVCALAGLMPGKAAEPHGVYHFSNRGSCSWWEFARAVLDLSGWLRAAPELEPARIAAAELARPARRPAYSVLDLSRIEAAGIANRPWRDALADFLAELRTCSPELFPDHGELKARLIELN